MLRILAWIYAVAGSLYFAMYTLGSEMVAQYARGPLWLLMGLAPTVLALLVIVPIAVRRGQFKG
jgi:hypothetical protein